MGCCAPIPASPAARFGTASSTSPLYPKPLAGQDYLTGSLTAPAITIRFPAPFELTLGGPVTLATGTTTFTNLPDIPLTDLKVTLAGGSAAAFAATCNPAVGTATSALTTQNGDRSVGVSAPFTVANCPSGSNGSGGSAGAGPGSGGGTPSGGAKAKAGQPTLNAAGSRASATDDRGCASPPPPGAAPPSSPF